MSDSPLGPKAVIRKPKLKAPPGACDTHLHVYGPFDKYPLASDNHTYHPGPTCTLDHYLKTHEALGIERAVIVTGAGNGWNNRITADALARMKGRFRAVALVDPKITDKELETLRDSYFTGFRIRTLGDVALNFEDGTRMADRVRGFGWHVEFHVQNTEDALQAIPKLVALRMPFVLDHVVRMRPEKGLDNADFRRVFDLFKSEENCWINLYSFYQLSTEGPPYYRDMIPMVRKLVEIAPKKLLWGTNWPHLGVKVPLPDDADLLDFLLEAVPEENIRTDILSTNPAKLYGWSK
jgi:2-pyrone-4,6-dicarboxylate lactonase